MEPTLPGLPSVADLQGLGQEVEDRASDQTNREAMVQLAREFEAMFVLQMLKQMRQTVGTLQEEDEGLGFGTEAMNDVVDQELARHLSQAGGLGLATMITRALERGGDVGTSGSAPGRISPGDRPPAPAPVASPPAVAPHFVGEPTALPLPLDAPITSGFGWRSDPLTGQGRFHAGVDIRAAYGREVPAAGPGRVVVAGDQGGYGTTVVLEHEGGVRSRYAHLSGTLVQLGEVVEAGQPIGHVGQTGRTTGPHLHFELTEAGRRVNPVVVANRYQALKELHEAADSPNGRTTQPATGVDNED